MIGDLFVIPAKAGIQICVWPVTFVYQNRFVIEVQSIAARSDRGDRDRAAQ